MSSLIRRIEIRSMKRSGYTRNKWIIATDPRTGLTYPKPVVRDGEITDRNDNPIGRDWPRQIVADAKPAYHKRQRADRVVFALRRSQNSQRWLEARAKARSESAQ